MNLILYVVSKVKPGVCCHLSFATNPVLSNFYENINYFIQFDILVPD